MQSTMSSKGAKYIVLPAYVVNIGLLYALLLTSGLILAWVTIYRHEECITELKQMLKKRKAEDNSRLSLAVGAIDDGRQQDEDVIGDLQKRHFSVDDSSQRSRRHSDGANHHLGKSNGSQKYFKGEKGQKGEKGEKGIKGKKGKHGRIGHKGETGRDGRNGRDGRDGLRGPKGDSGIRGLPGPPGLPGPQGYPGAPGSGGQKGSDGTIGDKGDEGEKGDKGEVGKTGKTGRKGDKGDKGSDGLSIMFSESAHIVGSGKRVKCSPGTRMTNPVVSWKPKHLSGSMSYKGGYLQVNVTGFYYIYSQMFYYDGSSQLMGHIMYIDDRKVLKAVHSVVNTFRRYQTQYLGGIFQISKGQKIWVGTPFTKDYYFKEASSYFGAFMLHH